MEKAIADRLLSVEKYKSYHQRRRRMSVVAPVNNKGNATDFEERIAICNRQKFSPFVLFIEYFLFLVDSDFRYGLFKLTAMLIHNIAESGKRIKSKDDLYQVLF